MKTLNFDYSAPAEFYTANRGRRRRASIDCKRFRTAARAIRYAIETLPAANLPGSLLEVNDQRFFHPEIRALYENASYPLKRPSKHPNSEVCHGKKAELSI